MSFTITVAPTLIPASGQTTCGGADEGGGDASMKRAGCGGAGGDGADGARSPTPAPPKIISGDINISDAGDGSILPDLLSDILSGGGGGDLLEDLSDTLSVGGGGDLLEDLVLASSSLSSLSPTDSQVRITESWNSFLPTNTTSRKWPQNSSRKTSPRQAPTSLASFW